MLQRNLRRQQEVTAQIEELGSSNAAGSRAREGMGGEGDGGVVYGSNANAKRSLAVFNPPYFKDARGFSHPPNADTIAKK